MHLITYVIKLKRLNNYHIVPSSMLFVIVQEASITFVMLHMLN